MLSKESILQADDLMRTAVDVPEWGGQVYVRTLTGKERDQFEEAAFKASQTASPIRGMRALLLCLALCDQDGERLFDDKDLVVLGAKSGLVLDRLFEQARHLNGLADESFEDAKKNSDNGPVVESGTV